MESVTIQKQKASKGVLNNRNFLLLWIGQCTSLIGDQFTMIALPWLVLMLTGDPLSLGIVLALEGVPRAVFMLLGGAITDRFSQRTVMIASDAVRLVLMAALAVLVLTGNVELWMIYALAFTFGIVSGFFMPASSSMVPRIVDGEHLMTGNSIIQGTSQLSVFIGPFLAGAVIALFSGGATAEGSGTGIGVAFAVDSFTFFISIVTLWMMKVAVQGSSDKTISGIVNSIKEGLRFVTGTPKILYLFIIIAVLNFLFSGPLVVGLPLIANERLPEGVTAFGIILGTFGIGNLIGLIVSGIYKISPKLQGPMTVGVVALFGIGMALTGFIGSMLAGAAIMLALGMFNGYISVFIVSMLQKTTPPEMMGRVMSLVMFANVGLVPVSQALAGFFLSISIEGVFAVCGALIVVMAIAALMVKEIRNIGTA